MWMDAVDLRDFYATPLGSTARRVIGRHIRSVWPDAAGMRVLGLGYPIPYLGSFRSEADGVFAAMPASQGVLRWPIGGPSETLLTNEAELPFPDMSIDRVLLVHTLEFAEQVRPMMREIWRVLNGSGRLLIVVPNRRGIWARFERTPFGHGRPYSPGQINRLLRDTMFTPLSTQGGLYVPPARSRMILSSAGAWENIGQRWFNAVGGILSLEAEKQIYAPTPAQSAPKSRRSYAAALKS
ncbi:MAG: methyltransferase domain-containing protein [Rhodospirillales bacterium]|nr:methyltransferase domain-containing protein [Rhodospirillales bacterium]